LQTLWLAALDERVDCAVISGYFYGVEDSLLGADDKFDVDFFDGGHVWHGTVAFDWLDRWLRGGERK
jgi:hypothetical protein